MKLATTKLFNYSILSVSKIVEQKGGSTSFRDSHTDQIDIILLRDMVLKWVFRPKICRQQHLRWIGVSKVIFGSMYC